jgi:hypothetical protein
MRLVVAVLIGMLAASCTECYVDCAIGYEQIPHSCSCRPIPYSGGAPGTPLGSCMADATCLFGLTCIEGCPSSRLGLADPIAGICSIAGRDTCGCGAVDDTCETAGTVCLKPACCDYQGVCVRPEERAAICARPEGAHFDCASK